LRRVQIKYLITNRDIKDLYNWKNGGNETGNGGCKIGSGLISEGGLGTPKAIPAFVVAAFSGRGGDAVRQNAELETRTIVIQNLLT
jgi:hypothetical protein